MTSLCYFQLFRAEAYHYLCEMAVEMEKLGLNEYTHEGTAATTISSAAPITPKAIPAAAPQAAKVNGATNKATPKKPAAPPTKVRSCLT